MRYNYLEIYHNSIIDLAATLVIKNELAAITINNWLTALGKQVSSDPTTWKYYKNISGEYHSTDTPMYITSLDTLSVILFSKENLRTHKATAKAYQYQTRHWRELVSNFPEQESLIRGIIYPVDMQKAIAAENGTILGYPSYLVEENEETLIEELETKIKNWLFRWNINAFSVTDPLYPAFNFGLLILNLIPTILNLRLKRCRTNEAHSFHIREYLASHNNLQDYMDYLTKEQTLWLYRNIPYLERNPGKNHIFKWLEENILSKRQIPLSEFNLRHNVSAIPQTLTNIPEFERKPINDISDNNPLNVYSLTDLLDLEKDHSVDNPIYRKDNYELMDIKLSHSAANELKTKVLYSRVTDYTDSVRYTIEDISLNYWVYLVSTNRYSVYTNFVHPRSNQTYPIKVSDALIYAMYCLGKSAGVELPTVPRYNYAHVQINPLVNVPDLMNMVDSRHITEDVAYDMLFSLPPITNITSVDDFVTLVKNVYSANIYHDDIVNSYTDPFSRAQARNMSYRLFNDSEVTLADTGKLFTTWIDEKRLPTDDFTQSEYLAIFDQLVTNATGYNDEQFNHLRQTQKSLIKLFSQLSSYSVQFISSINETRIIPLDGVNTWAAGRVVGGKNNNDVDASGEVYLQDLRIDDFTFNTGITNTTVFETDVILNNYNLESGCVNEITVDLSVNTELEFETFNALEMPLSMMVTCSIETDEIYPGYNSFMALTPEQRLQIKDPSNKC